MKMAGGGISDEAYVVAVQLRKFLRFLESIDITLDEINKKLDGPGVIEPFTAEAQALFDAHAADLQQTLSERAGRELGEVTLADIFVMPETDDDKQRLGKWIEQLDKCQCPIQVRIEHDGCCEHREQDEHA